MRVPLKSFWVFGVAAALLVLTGCVTAKSLDELPSVSSYPGSIRPFNSPILIRYRDTPTMVSEKMDYGSVVRGSFKQEFTSKFTWNYKIEKTLGFVDHVFDFKGVTKRGDDINKNFGTLDAIGVAFRNSKFYLTTDEWGKFQNMSGQGPLIDSWGDNYRQKMFGRWNVMFSGMTYRLSRAPIEEESEIITWSIRGSGDASILGGTLRGFAKGLVTHGGRDAVIFSVEGVIDGGVIPVPIGGYGLIDIEYGVVLLMEVKSIISKSNKTSEFGSSSRITFLN